MRRHGEKSARRRITVCALVILVITGSVLAVLHFRPLYYFDIDHLHLAGFSGMETADIKANYDALIDYNSIFYRQPLQFPTLPMSEGGRIHFAEVKVIFSVMEILFLLSLPAGIALAAVALKRGEYRFLKHTALILAILPTALGIFAAISWEMLFLSFHLLFFRNDLWLFSPLTDPIISILPDTFFLHCALAIFLLILMIAGVLFLVYRVLRKRDRKAAM